MAFEFAGCPSLVCTDFKAKWFKNTHNYKLRSQDALTALTSSYVMIVASGLLASWYRTSVLFVVLSSEQPNPFQYLSFFACLLLSKSLRQIKAFCLPKQWPKVYCLSCLFVYVYIYIYRYASIYACTKHFAFNEPSKCKHLDSAKQP